MNIKPSILAIGALVFFLLGIWAGKWVWGTTKVVHEVSKAAVVLPATATSPHGALILAREPDRLAKPAQAIPKGDKVERVAQVTVKPTASEQGAADRAAAPDCPPVTFDMTTITEPDGGERLIASSPDGKMVGGFDVPIQPMLVPAVHRWAAGASYGSDRTYGGWLDRDVGRIRLGAEVNQMPGGGLAGRVKLGFTFGG